MKTFYEIPTTSEGEIDSKKLRHDFNQVIYGIEVAHSARPITIQEKLAQKELLALIRAELQSFTHSLEMKIQKMQQLNNDLETSQGKPEEQLG